ncbi:MAG: sugar O-acetyltransferase [Oscillospiraceae bacterium]|jgi:maltose O-acetyltransferase
MTERERMVSGGLYKADDGELVALRQRARRLTRQFNATTEEELDKRQELLRELFGAFGGNSFMEPSFRCDYGVNIFIGEHFYANFDCVILDVAPVHIGDNVFFAPRVNLYTAGHPIDAGVRNEELEFGKPITIGDDVWVGGGVIVNPGVTIGSDVVIGSGSVVTKDIPSHVIAAGNPCRVIRAITDEDKVRWTRERDAYFADREKEWS